MFLLANRFPKIFKTALASALLAATLPAAASGEKIGAVSTAFKLIGPNHIAPDAGSVAQARRTGQIAVV